VHGAGGPGRVLQFAINTKAFLSVVLAGPADCGRPRCPCGRHAPGSVLATCHPCATRPGIMPARCVLTGFEGSTSVCLGNLVCRSSCRRRQFSEILRLGSQSRGRHLQGAKAICVGAVPWNAHAAGARDASGRTLLIAARRHLATMSCVPVARCVWLGCATAAVPLGPAFSPAELDLH